MPHIAQTLKERFHSAVTAALGDRFADTDPLIGLSTNPRFGDYQANVAMGLGKAIGEAPRQVAQKIVDALDVADLCDKVEIAGPGFINLGLSDAFIDQELARVCVDDRLGVPRAADPQTIVVDYSGPNVAKEMHVGHLRSTVIGDSIARILEFRGHTVVRQNHIGDWGTQFGMLIEHLVDGAIDLDEGDQNLTAIYQAAKRRFDEDAEFADAARARVVALQAGDDETKRWWERLVEMSRVQFQVAYDRLDVSLTNEHIRGESAYNEALPDTVQALEDAGLLEHSQGAAVVYPDGFKNRDGDPMPMIVRKSDGGYLYATTDLAAARYRIDQLGAKRLIYVTDARQSQHFAMLFSVLRESGWAPQEVRCDHVCFGTVLGKDNRPFKTRSGETVKLKDLLDEAERRALEVVTEKNAGLPLDQRERVAHVIGIGALKYADLANDRVKDYVFDWDRMLAFDGNTAPYLQNAYVRIRSIFRKGGIDPADLSKDHMVAADPAERALAVKLFELASVVESVSQSLEPHRLCTYLYELAAGFHRFYERCPVLTAPDDGTRRSRLSMCRLVGRALESGLGLLGIGVVDKM